MHRSLIPTYNWRGLFCFGDSYCLDGWTWLTSQETQRGAQTQRGRQKSTHVCTKYCIFHSSALSSLHTKSSQSGIITMMCKSAINYKYSIASLQSATEIGADNLQKQRGCVLLKNVLCLFGRVLCSQVCYSKGLV